MITIGTKQELLTIVARPIPRDPIEPSITRHRDENAGVVVDRTHKASDVSILFNVPTAQYRQEVAPSAGAGTEFDDISRGKVLLFASSKTRTQAVRSTLINNIRWREGPPGVAWEDGPAVAWADIDTSDDFS